MDSDYVVITQAATLRLLRIMREARPDDEVIAPAVRQAQAHGVFELWDDLTKGYQTTEHRLQLQSLIKRIGDGWKGLPHDSDDVI